MWLYELRGMKEWGLVENYWQYLALPEPVKVCWRICASEEADSIAWKMEHPEG